MTPEKILVEAYKIAYKANDAEALMRIAMVMRDSQIQKLNIEGNS